MATRTSTTPGDLAGELAALGVGGGVITMAAFPLALPIILLTVAAVTPLVLVTLAVGLVLAILAAPVLLVRQVRRSIRSGSGRLPRLLRPVPGR